MKETKSQPMEHDYEQMCIRAKTNGEQKKREEIKAGRMSRSEHTQNDSQQNFNVEKMSVPPNENTRKTHAIVKKNRTEMRSIASCSAENPCDLIPDVPDNYGISVGIFIAGLLCIPITILFAFHLLGMWPVIDFLRNLDC